MLTLRRENLKLKHISGMLPAQGSSDIEITIENDGTYSGYSPVLLLGYGFQFSRKFLMVNKNSTNKYVITSDAFADGNDISLAILLVGSNKVATNQLIYSVNKTPYRTVESKKVDLWRDNLEAYVDAYLESIGAGGLPQPYTLPIATSETLGGVKPVAKTDKMTQPVGVDENGALFTQPTNAGSTITTDPTLSKPGQAADAKAVGDQFSKLKEDKVDKNDITLGVHTDGLIYIFIGGVPMGGGLNISGGNVEPPKVDDVYGQPLTDNSLLKMVQGTSAILGIKLDTKPTQAQTLTISSDTNVLSFDKQTLEFTTENWNEYQFVTITTSAIEEDVNANIILTNSDELLTDKNIPIYVLAEGYTVDTTIPTEGQHIVTVDDFTSTSNYGDYIRLNGYKAEYDNIVIPSTLNGKIPWLTCNAPTPTTSNTSFYGNTTIKYVTLEDGVIYRGAGTTSGCQAQELFKNCTNLIGVSNMNPDVTSFRSAFIGCTSLKFIDNLDKLVNVDDVTEMFNGCSELEYVQDLSNLKLVKYAQKVFLNCAKLKRVFGIFELADMTTQSKNINQLYSGCTLLESGEIPKNANTLFYAFNNCTSLRKATIHATEISSSEVASAFNSCKDLKVYAEKDTTTYANLISSYGNNANITILTMDNTVMPSIVVWGDSTSSPNRTWKEYPLRLIEQVDNYQLKNQAVSGEYTTSTSARQGGNALKVGAFTIPSDTSEVEITLTSQDGQTFGTSPIFSCGGSFNPCTINGVKGTIIHSGKGVYKFARYEEGASVEVEANTIVTSNADDLFNNADNIMLINLGINQGWNNDTDVLLNQVQLMVDHFTSKGGTKYIICSPFTIRNASEEVTTPQYETKALARFGEHFINLRQYMIDNGLTENGLTPSALDTERMVQGKVPASLLGAGGTTDIPMYDGVTVTDDTHPNAYGHETIKNAFYNKGKALGYWN